MAGSLAMPWPRPPRSASGVSLRSERSVPAQNDPGTPVRMTARASGSSAACWMASRNSRSTEKLMAFFFSGRSMVIVPMPSDAS